jgi:hypothetical protein
MKACLIYHNNKLCTILSADKVMKYVHDNYPGSFDHAIKHGGFRVEETMMIDVYTWPNGFAKEAQNMYLCLHHANLTPHWGDCSNGTHCIQLPESEVSCLRLMQKANPARWGNCPKDEKVPSPTTIYEACAYLYGYPHLEGKPATMEYLPTKHSRKWRTGFFVKAYSNVAYNQAIKSLQQGQFYAFRFMIGCP